MEQYSLSLNPLEKLKQRLELMKASRESLKKEISNEVSDIEKQTKLLKEKESSFEDKRGYRTEVERKLERDKIFNKKMEEALSKVIETTLGLEEAIDMHLKTETPLMDQQSNLDQKNDDIEKAEPDSDALKESPIPQKEESNKVQPNTGDSIQKPEAKDIEEPVQLNDEDIQLEARTQSDQLQKVGQYFKVISEYKYEWNNLHCIFILDCSSTIKKNWNNIKTAYLNALQKLLPMKEIKVSTCLFDEKNYPISLMSSVEDAIKAGENMVCTAKVKNSFESPIKWAFDLISAENTTKYLNFVIFISDGPGDFPQETMEKLNSMKESGQKNICFAAIGCVAEDDESNIIRLCTSIDGEYYTLTDGNVTGKVVLRILKLEQDIFGQQGETIRTEDANYRKKFLIYGG